MLFRSIYNRKIRDIYLSTISNGKHNPSVQPSGITRIEADKTEFDLGSLKEGDSRKICVTIRNIGKLPLIIHDARTSCGCVQIDYIKRPVASGNTTEINLTYHADIRLGLSIKQSLSTVIWILRH